MFITLTNASPAFKGQRVTLNKSAIVSIWRADAARAVDENGTVTDKEEVTFIFAPPHGTWEVQETHDEILGLLAE